MLLGELAGDDKLSTCWRWHSQFKEVLPVHTPNPFASAQFLRVKLIGKFNIKIDFWCQDKESLFRSSVSF